MMRAVWFAAACVMAGSIATGAAAGHEVTIPLHAGIHNGGEVLYVITDVSNGSWPGGAQDWNAQITPSLLAATESNVLYVFANGMAGGGLMGHQPDVFEHAPGVQYSALSRVVELTWVADPHLLVSATNVTSAIQDGRIVANHTGVVVNAPHLVWPDGQLATNSTYGAGPLMQIDRQTMTATLVAYHALGPDEQPIHYILTGSSSPHLAEDLGVAYSPLLSAANHTVMFWLRGDPAEFPQGMATSVPGNDTYSPVWLIHNATGMNDTAYLNGPVVELPPTKLGGVDLSMASPLLGNAGAPVTIIEFGDYQCSNCGRWFDNTKPVIDENYLQTGKANMYFVDLAFIGSHSSTAAAATYCAQEQNMYWEFHDMLYENQGRIQSGWAGHDGVVRIAQNLGLDLLAFETCLDGNHQDRVDFNREQARIAGFDHTPSFLVVGPGGIDRITGNQPYAVFERVIENMEN